ncbi:HAMP domain-containing protein [Paenibacillus antri]|uniref:HAMP domain-containing protein n=1 Tax=Paenibacillus antri TaxID=2582848 RepID=A0A5R9FZ41_9BACL|nr:histidine kinase [Paenibacillus antri]TLS48781.1 HAMP domain-containing protein [Paenibacillus antri]
MQLAFRWLKSLRIFPKLVLAFLLALGPIYYIGLTMNRSGAEHVRAEIGNSLMSRVNLYTEILDVDFDRTIRLMQEFVNDVDLLELSVAHEVMTDIERTEAVLRVKHRIDLLRQSSVFVRSAFAMIPSLDRTISSEVTAITELERDQLEALLQIKNLYESPFLEWNGRLFISVPYPDAGTAKTPLFVVAVEVSKAELTKALERFTSEGGGAVLTGRRIPWTVDGGLEADRAQALRKELERLGVSASGEARTVTVGGVSYLLSQQASDRLDVTMSMFVPSEQIEAPLRDSQRWLIVLSAASVALVITFSYSIYRMIHRPLKSFMQAFRRLEQGNFNVELRYSFQDEFGYLYDQFNATVRQLNVLVHEVYEQQYRARLSELRHLQSQINPHFLYNTYFLLYRMAQRKDFDNVVPLTKHLGEYFQYITRDGMDEVPYEAEAAHAKTYMDIQSIRFEDRIQAAFEPLPEGAGAVLVPRLVLQPIIENAYKHALEKKESDARLVVVTELIDDVLRVKVIDNGDRMTPELAEELQAMLDRSDDAIETTGLVNVHRRLRIKYGENAGLRLRPAEPQGLSVEMRIPWEENAG